MKLLLLLLSGIFVFAGQESPGVAEARRQWDQIRQQVDAGIAPASKLDEAQRAIDDAADEAVLGGTLYGKMRVEDLNPAQAGEMLAAAERRVDRIEQQIEHGNALIASGVVALHFNDELEAELARRTQALALAKDRSALVAGILNMANAEAAESAKVESSGEKPSGEKKAEEFVAGDHGLAPSDIKDITLAYEKKFDKPLPVSARGETAVHRALGFDHTGRIDVALMPDSTEGVWLRRYLESKSIPYYAFRAAIAGKATAAHIHIGPGSTRLRVAD